LGEGAAKEFSVLSETGSAFVAFEVKERAIDFKGAGEGLRGSSLKGLDNELESNLSAFPSGHGFTVATPAIILGILDQTGADGVEVDVGGHGGEGVAGAVDQDTAEAFLPEGALAAGAAIEPLGEALLEQFHEIERSYIRA
jgi:hypothetical protein